MNLKIVKAPGIQLKGLCLLFLLLTICSTAFTQEHPEFIKKYDEFTKEIATHLALLPAVAGDIYADSLNHIKRLYLMAIDGNKFAEEQLLHLFTCRGVKTLFSEFDIINQTRNINIPATGALIDSLHLFVSHIYIAAGSFSALNNQLDTVVQQTSAQDILKGDTSAFESVAQKLNDNIYKTNYPMLIEFYNNNPDISSTSAGSLLQNLTFQPETVFFGDPQLAEDYSGFISKQKSWYTPENSMNVGELKGYEKSYMSNYLARLIYDMVFVLEIQKKLIAEGKKDESTAIRELQEISKDIKKFISYIERTVFKQRYGKIIWGIYTSMKSQYDFYRREGLNTAQITKVLPEDKKFFYMYYNIQKKIQSLIQ